MNVLRSTVLLGLLVIAGFQVFTAAQGKQKVKLIHSGLLFPRRPRHVLQAN